MEQNRIKIAESNRPSRIDPQMIAQALGAEIVDFEKSKFRNLSYFYL
jgi:hypothetical protein